MKVSVACCVYNGAAFLRRQLESIAAQTTRPAEVVIVDDRSTDASADLIDAFAREHATRFDIVRQRNAVNLGIVRNFEKAIGLTTGELILLADQDDVWRPDKVAVVVAAFEREPALDFLFTDARLVDAHDQPLPHTLFHALEYTAGERRLIAAGDAFGAFLARNLATGATCALRRRVFERALPFPREWVHDEWLAIVAASSGRVACLDETLIDYRQHEANQIGMRRLTISDKLRKLFQHRADRYTKLERRVEVLSTRMNAAGFAISPEKRVAIAEKLAHVRRRRALPATRIVRLVPVLSEWARGRYHRYSSGMRSVLRDLTEPD